MSAAPDTPAPAGGGALKVAVLAGGRSSEHDVSLSSGAAVRAGLSAAGHEVLPVEIARDGRWRADGEPLSVTPGGGLLEVDVVFPVLHGPFGEDGVIQGYLEALDVPYVGSGVAASAVGMDKVAMRRAFAVARGPTACRDWRQTILQAFSKAKRGLRGSSFDGSP